VCEEHEGSEDSKSFRSPRVRVIFVAGYYAFAMPEVHRCVDGPCTAAVFPCIHTGIAAHCNWLSCLECHEEFVQWLEWANAMPEGCSPFMRCSAQSCKSVILKFRWQGGICFHGVYGQGESYPVVLYRRCSWWVGRGCSMLGVPPCGSQCTCVSSSSGTVLSIVG